MFPFLFNHFWPLWCAGIPHTGRGVLRCTGLNPGRCPRVGRASTRGDGSQMPSQSPLLGGTVLALTHYDRKVCLENNSVGFTLFFVMTEKMRNLFK